MTVNYSYAIIQVGRYIVSIKIQGGMIIMKIDIDEFYKELGISKRASKNTIREAYTRWFLEWDSKDTHTEEDYEKLYYMCKIKNELLNAEKKDNDYQRVTDMEEAPVKTVTSGKLLIASLGTIALTTAIVATLLNSEINKTKENNKEINSSTSIAASSDTNLIEETNEASTSVVLNDYVNDNDFMENLAQEEWQKISLIKNSDSTFAPSIYDSNVLYEIIRWIHHGEPIYTGDWILSNEDANARLSELVSTSYDVSQLYKGTSIYSNINKLRNAISKITPENGSYNDELDAYKDLKDVLENMDTNNFVEVITIRVLAKYMISDARYTTMRDIAFDKSNLSSADVQLCKDAFNKVNDDTIFSISLQNAINEDKANKGRVLS